MKKSTQTTIKDTARAMKLGVHEGVARWALIMDGWQAKKADQIIAWAKMFVEVTKGQECSYPDTTTITVEPDEVS